VFGWFCQISCCGFELFHTLIIKKEAFSITFLIAHPISSTPSFKSPLFTHTPPLAYPHTIYTTTWLPSILPPLLPFYTHTLLIHPHLTCAWYSLLTHPLSIIPPSLLSTTLHIYILLHTHTLLLFYITKLLTPALAILYYKTTNTRAWYSILLTPALGILYY